MACPLAMLQLEVRKILMISFDLLFPKFHSPKYLVSHQKKFWNQQLGKGKHSFTIKTH